MKDLYSKIRNIKSNIPIGQDGNWKVERFVVDEKGAAFHNLREAINGRDREIVTGTYTKLTCNGEIIMSDTPAEISDHLHFICRASGNVLVNGLGLGLVVEGLMLNSQVKHITVIEISPEVIRLVGRHLGKKYNGKLEIINADAFSWIPPKGKMIYDCVWHDIWPNICGDYYPEMKKLHRKYAQKTKWQDSWCKEEIRFRARI
jgi:hypothetical protein